MWFDRVHALYNLAEETLMNIEYVPLLQIARDLQGMPRNLERFCKYLQVVGARDSDTINYPPLIAMNPMGKEHVTEILDELLALDADDIAEDAIAEVTDDLPQLQGDFKAGLVVVDDLMGGWTNRYSDEYTYRFSQEDEERPRPRWLKDDWLTFVLWSSETPTEQSVRESIRTTLYRIAYVKQHGSANTLRDMLAQEGWVMAVAGCTEPTLDQDDIEYTREVLVPFMDASDMRTCIECLFGDEAGQTLGFTPRGLSPWAGLALGLHDAKAHAMQPTDEPLYQE
jgi:hypothetical protein